MSVKKSAVAVGGRQMKAPSLMRTLLKRCSKSGDFAQRWQGLIQGSKFKVDGISL
jgi:hypothetical protein